MIKPGEINLPAEFQVALYENLVQQLQKEGGFAQVYRDGSRNATDASDLVILQTVVTGYKKAVNLSATSRPLAGPPPLRFIAGSRIKQERCCWSAISMAGYGSSATT